MTMRMIGRVRLEAGLHVLTGLHIGAGKDTIEIGGIDNPVIKHPHTGEPFVPGSSLKGRARYLLEWAFGLIRQDGHPWGFNENDPQQTFDAEFVFRIYDTGDGGARDRQCLAWFIQGLDLLELDAVGGSGSRGYGRIKFENLTLIGLDGKPQTLDNVFRGHAFDRTTPAVQLSGVIE